MKKYILLAAVSFLLAACSNDDDTYTADAPVEARITATIGESAVSRASNTTWNSGDAIGITSGVGKYVNMKYTTTGNGEFTGNKIYFKNKSEPEDFIAYYPFTGAEGTIPALVEASTEAAYQTPAAQPDIDFLYAKVTDQVAADDPSVAFSFAHKMSKITLTLVNGLSDEGGTHPVNVSLVNSYKIEGLVLDGTFDTENGVCAARIGSDPADLTMDVTGTVQTGVALPPLIVFPQSTQGKHVMLRIFDSEGGKYFCELSFADSEIKAGNNYQYKVRVNKIEMVLETSTITRWVEKDEEFDATIDK